jgi:putative spermidine/putrescine transport system permease protein
LLIPAVATDVAVFLAPLGRIVRFSLDRAIPGGGIQPALTLANYAAFLADPFRLQEMGRTLMLGGEVTLATLVLSYPIALFLARTRSRWRGVLVTLAIAPLLTSAVVRTYAWIVILGNAGLINSFLQRAGLVGTPIALVNNMTGVVIALVHILMPYMILSLLAVFGRFNPDLEDAAMTLGANPWRVFHRITLPLSLPGIVTGCLIVFVLTISSFITPQLLGGGRVFLMATEIYQQATYTLNWPFAAAISLLLLLLSATVVIAYTRLLRAAMSGVQES